jgi:hypothetical protein
MTECSPPYGTAAGLYQVRVGKNCMPYSPDAFQRRQVSTGMLDWSAQPADGVDKGDLDPTEIARLRNVLHAHALAHHCLILMPRNC